MVYTSGSALCRGFLFKPGCQLHTGPVPSSRQVPETDARDKCQRQMHNLCVSSQHSGMGTRAACPLA